MPTTPTTTATKIIVVIPTKLFAKMERSATRRATTVTAAMVRLIRIGLAVDKQIRRGNQIVVQGPNGESSTLDVR